MLHIGRIPMLSAFSSSLQSVSVCTVIAVPMLSANVQHCKRRLKTAHWAGTFWRHYFLNDKFEITVVLDDRDVELRIRVSVSMPGKNFSAGNPVLLHIAIEIAIVVCEGWCI